MITGEAMQTLLFSVAVLAMSLVSNLIIFIKTESSEGAQGARDVVCINIKLSYFV